MAVSAFRKARMKNSTLVLIGSEFNDYAREVMSLDERLAGQYPEGRVVFIEKLERSLTLAAYSACDIFLLASKAETQPIVLLEAMAAGIPFVSTDTGCVSELPGGIVACNEAALSAALAERHDNEAKRRELGDLGRKAVLESFTREKVVDAYAALIEELVS